jgi:hypothetical protein
MRSGIINLDEFLYELGSLAEQAARKTSLAEQAARKTILAEQA